MNKIIGGLLPHKKDIRDFSYSQKFGSISPLVLPKEFYLENPEEVRKRIKQQGGTDACTAFSLTSVSEFQEGVILSPEYQFAKIKQITGDINGFGANLRDAAKSVIKFGSIKQEDSPFELEV